MLPAFVSRRGAALLSRLVCFPNRVHSRDVLAEEIWPGEDVEAVSGRFRKTLSLLRGELGAQADTLLDVRRHTLGIHTDAVVTDVAEFVQAVRSSRLADTKERKQAAVERAMSLYRGEFLPGYYEDWIVAERDRLASLYADLQTLSEKITSDSVLISETALRVPVPKVHPVFHHPGVQVTNRPATRFFGREQEHHDVIEYLTHPTNKPLVTLTGAGGTGKTRLALEIAHTLQETFAGRVFFIGMQDIARASELPERLRDALGIPRSRTEDANEQVLAFLSGVPNALLIWDNFETLAETGTLYIGSLQEQFPHIAFLITSRRRLGLQNEQDFPLTPLATPAYPCSVSSLLEFPAVALLYDRARLMQSDFVLNDANAAAIAALCHYLEGIPLALELAATRLALLAPEDLLKRLQGKRFDLLKTRHQDSAVHHQSLFEVMESSFAHLSPREQRLLAQLSVFRGGFALDLAEAVCTDPEDAPFAVMDGISVLRDHSLLITESTGMTGLRFRMLETVREFAETKLQASEQALLRHKHGEALYAIAQEARQFLSHTDETRWMDRLEADACNLCIAVQFWSEQQPLQALSLVSLLDHFYIFRGRIAEGSSLVNELLAKTEGQVTLERLDALLSASLFALFQSNFHAVLTYSDAAEVLALAYDSPHRLTQVYTNRGRALIALGNLKKAEIAWEQSLKIADSLGWRSLIQAERAQIALYQGDFERARQLIREARSTKKQDPRSQTFFGFWEGTIHLEEGDLRTAETIFHENLTCLQTEGLVSHQPQMQVALATTLFLLGHEEDALRHAIEAAQSAFHQGIRLQYGAAQRLRGVLQARQGHLREASATLCDALNQCRENDPPHVWARYFETVAAVTQDSLDIARLLNYCEVFRANSEIPRTRWEEALLKNLPQPDSAPIRDSPQTLTEAIQLAKNILHSLCDSQKIHDAPLNYSL